MTSMANPMLGEFHGPDDYSRTSFRSAGLQHSSGRLLQRHGRGCIIRADPEVFVGNSGHPESERAALGDVEVLEP